MATCNIGVVAAAGVPLAVWWLVDMRVDKGSGRLLFLEGNEKCKLVLQFVIALIAPPIDLELLILCNCTHVRNSMLALNVRACFILVFDF